MPESDQNECGGDEIFVENLPTDPGFLSFIHEQAKRKFKAYGPGGTFDRDINGIDRTFRLSPPPEILSGAQSAKINGSDLIIRIRCDCIDPSFDRPYIKTVTVPLPDDVFERITGEHPSPASRQQESFTNRRRLDRNDVYITIALAAVVIASLLKKDSTQEYIPQPQPALPPPAATPSSNENEWRKDINKVVPYNRRDWVNTDQAAESPSDRSADWLFDADGYLVPPNMTDTDRKAFDIIRKNSQPFRQQVTALDH